MTASSDRRRSGSHYTPMSMAEPLTKNSLEVLITQMGSAPSSEQILNLRVCDPTVGSGAFLVAACRYLGEQVVAAWTREGKLPPEDAALQAQRLVAQLSLYGVDKNPSALTLSTLALQMLTLRAGKPVSFHRHSLRCGDSLVGTPTAESHQGDPKPRDFEALLDFGKTEKQKQQPRSPEEQQLLELLRLELEEAIKKSVEARAELAKAIREDV